MKKFLFILLVFSYCLCLSQKTYTWNFPLTSWQNDTVGNSTIILNKINHSLNFTIVTTGSNTVVDSGWYYTQYPLTTEIDFPSSSTTSLKNTSKSGYYLYYSKINYTSSGVSGYSYHLLSFFVDRSKKIIKAGANSIGSSVFIFKELSDTTCLVTLNENENLLAYQMDSSNWDLIIPNDTMFWAKMITSDSMVWSNNDNFGIAGIDIDFSINKPYSDSDSVYYKRINYSQYTFYGRRYYERMEGIRISTKISSWL